MNVEQIIKTKKKIPLTSRTIIHFMLVNNKINEATANALRPFEVSEQQFNTTPTKEERMAHDKIITITEGGVTDAFRTDIDNAYGKFIVNTLTKKLEEQVVQIRIMGGTVPIAPFINELKIPAFVVPMVNPDNNQHSPNENLKIGQIAYGIEVFYEILSTKM